MRAGSLRAALLTAALGLPLLDQPAAHGQGESAMPERVTFASADGRTTLIGYLFKPTIPLAQPMPAVVMMHGRAGAYSERANGKYDASTLSLRHKAWGQEWVKAGYIAILVDGFGPRGYPNGFPRFSYDSRPSELNEVTVRPLDAYGALAYLRSRPDVMPTRIGLQGWSNGASAAIAAMSVEAPGLPSARPLTGFRAAIAFYPACGLEGRFEDKPFRPYAPMLVLHGSADEEVSSSRCASLVEKSRANGSNVEIKIYPGATHSFDSPSRKRQKVDANSAAAKDAVARSLGFFERYLRSR